MASLTNAAREIIAEWGRLNGGGNPAAAASLVRSSEMSPFLADLFNGLAEKETRLLVGEPGKGSGASGNMIFIDPNEVNNLVKSELGEMQLATLLAHEMSHILLLDGHSTAFPKELNQAIEQSRRNEGIGLSGEIIVGVQMRLGKNGRFSYSDQGQLAAHGTLAQIFLSSVTNVDVSKLESRAQVNQLIQLNSFIPTSFGELNGKAKSSIAPHLDTDQYHAQAWAVATCSSVNPNSIDWT